MASNEGVYRFTEVITSSRLWGLLQKKSAVPKSPNSHKYRHNDGKYRDGKSTEQRVQSKLFQKPSVNMQKKGFAFAFLARGTLTTSTTPAAMTGATRKLGYNNLCRNTQNPGVGLSSSAKGSYWDRAFVSCRLFNIQRQLLSNLLIICTSKYHSQVHTWIRRQI